MIGFAAEVARWALVLVFAAAVIGKFVQPDGMTGLAATLRTGLRLPLAGPAALALVAAEAAVAILLAVPLTLPAGLLAAGLLSAALTAGTVVLARRADALPCRCFGSASSVVTWASVVRNAVLTALALGSLAVLPATVLGAVETLLALATAAAALLAIRSAAAREAGGRGAVHQHAAGSAPVTLPPNGPDVGTPAPAVPGGTLPPRPGGVRLVAFASAGCRGCRLALPRLVSYAALLGGGDRVVVAVVGDPAEAADIEAAVSDVARVVGGVRADGLAAVYGVVLFPTYVLVADDGLVEAVTLSVDELPRPVR